MSLPINRGSLVLAAAVFAVSTGCAYAHVNSGEIGIVRTPNGMRPDLLKTGDWPIGYYDDAKVYSTRSQERAEQLEVLAANGLKVVLDASVRYHIVGDEVLALDQELGIHYYSILIGPTLRSEARKVVGRYQPEEIYSTQREVIARQILEGVETHIKGRHLVLEAVLIRNVQLPEAIQQAINSKLEAEQEALKMKFVIAQAQAEAEKQVIQQKSDAERSKIAAQARAEALRVDAQARADAKRLEGQAQADYQKSLQAGLTPQLLSYYQVEATRALANSPNAKLIYLGAGKAPGSLVDLRGVRPDVPLVPQEERQ